MLAIESLKTTLRKQLSVYRRVFALGLLTNLLLLVPSWYMLEVYDRVINSQNLMTLAMLSLLAVMLYVLLECIEWQRKRAMHMAALSASQLLQKQIYEKALSAKLNNPDFPAQQVFSDVDQLKAFLHSSTLLSLMDVPYIAIFLGAIFLIHPTLGLLTSVGLVLQLVMTLLNQRRIDPMLKEANAHAVEAQRYFGHISDKADVIQAMGMQPAIEQRWLVSQHAFLLKQAFASELAAKNAATSKFLQVLQSALTLGLGCYLVINGELSNGGAMMIIASILATRVLSPLVQLVAQWKTLAQTKEAYARIEHLLSGHAVTASQMQLPAPTGEITVEHLSYTPARFNGHTLVPFLKNIQCQLTAGSVLVVAGPSASGKTTLSLLLAGILAPNQGHVRFDGADAYHWDKRDLGPHMGYMSQQVDLFQGSLAENITRFGEPHPEKLAQVVELLHLQPLIDQLPQGLDTQIGVDGAYLSGGQRQLIGLARAAYGNPRIVILDEPNANLDQAGEKLLQGLIQHLKQQGTTVVIISHLQQIVNVADYLMIMVQGQVMRFGKPHEVMQSLQNTSVKVASA